MVAIIILSIAVAVLLFLLRRLLRKNKEMDDTIASLERSTGVLVENANTLRKSSDALAKAYSKREADLVAECEELKEKYKDLEKRYSVLVKKGERAKSAKPKVKEVKK